MSCDCADEGPCEPATGRCICPPGRTGQRCEKGPPLFSPYLSVLEFGGQIFVIFQTRLLSKVTSFYRLMIVKGLFMLLSHPAWSTVMTLMLILARPASQAAAVFFNRNTQTHFPRPGPPFTGTRCILGWIGRF